DAACLAVALDIVQALQALAVQCGEDELRRIAQLFTHARREPSGMEARRLDAFALDAPARALLEHADVAVDRLDPARRRIAGQALAFPLKAEPRAREIARERVAKRGDLPR